MQQSPHRGESFFRPGTLIAAATSSSNSGPGGQPDRSATAVFRSPAESACDSPGGRAYGPADRYGQRRFAAGPGVRSTRRRIGDGPNRLPPVKTPESDSALAAPQKQLPYQSTKAPPEKNESLPTNDLRQERFFIRSRPPADDTAPQRLFRLRRSLLPGSGCRQNNPTVDSQWAPKSDTGRNIRPEQTAGASPRPHSRSSAAAGSFLPPHARQGRQIRRDMRSGR